MNPTGQPFQPPFAAPQPPPGNARQDLNIPGLLLMVFGGLAVLWDLFNYVRSIGKDSAAELSDALRQFNLPDATLKRVVDFATGPVATGLSLLAMLLALLMVFGGYQMRQLKLYAVAVTACVVAVLPCQSFCCLTMPIGIWGLVLLLRPEVRAQFS